MNPFAQGQGTPANILAAIGAARIPVQAGLSRRSSLNARPGDLIGQDLYDALEGEDPQGEAAVKKIYERVRLASLEGRAMLERGWWQKLLYINGRQWIYYSPRGGWRDKRLARWIPRPVTNVTAETVDSIRALLTSNTPTLRVRPNGNEPINVLTAQIADDLEPVIAEEHEMDRRFFEADFWAPALGCCWLHPYWDKDDPRHVVEVRMLQCGACGETVSPLDVEESETGDACPNCGQPGLLTPATDPQTGQPVTTVENIGAGKTDVVSPLEMLIPTFYQRWEDVGELIRLRWRPETYYEGRDYYNRIQFTSTTAEQSLQMFRSLALMSDLSTAPFQWGGATPTRQKGAIEAELWVKPQVSFPDGLWVRAVGGLHGETVIVRDPERGVMPGPIPFRDQADRPLWLWDYYPFRETGGRLWAMGALEPVIQKQDQINRNDSMVELIMQRMANPIWLEPKGAEIQRFTGEPGLIVRYSIVAGSNAKPERLEGMNPGQSFFQLRDQYMNDVERLAGTQDVLKGMRPQGVEAFSALNLIVEEAQSRFVPILKARGRTYRDWYANAIELERSYGPTTRIKTVAGQAGNWTFKTFKKQDLEGAITVVIEDGSTTPKTSLGKRAALQDAKTLGLINPANPDTALAALGVLGVPELAPGLDSHTRAAQTEQEQYEAWVEGGRQGGPAANPLVVRAWQQHPIHIQQHDVWANGDAIRGLCLKDPAVAMEITLHRSQHVIAQANPFGLPLPPNVPPPGLGAPAGPAQPMPFEGPTPTPGMLEPGATQPQPPVPTGGAPAGGGPPQGAGLATQNVNRELNGVHTLPGNRTGAGNMARPA